MEDPNTTADHVPDGLATDEEVLAHEAARRDELEATTADRLDAQAEEKRSLDKAEDEGPIAHSGPLTLSVEEHNEARGLLEELHDHVDAEAFSALRRLARLLRHA